MTGRIAYAAAVLLGFAAATFAKRAYERRHGTPAGEHRRTLAVAAIVGAVLGSKLGMLFYLAPDEWLGMVLSMSAIGDGKTIVGAIAGGFLAVELTKRHLGITARTGDAYSVALPLGAAIGRIGCAFAGCCFGRPTDLPIAVHLDGVGRHPSALYESAMLFAIAAFQVLDRDRPRPDGERFRRSLIAMAAARFVAEAFRGDATFHVGYLTVIQWLCLAFIAIFVVDVRAHRARLGLLDAEGAREGV